MAIRVVHPFPSVLNAIVVLGLSLLAGAGLVTAGVLAVGMLGIQFAIGAANDFVDSDLDAKMKPDKPIPAGRVGRRRAAAIAVVSGVVGIVAAAMVDPIAGLLAAAMLGVGMAYNLFLKRGPFSWLAYAAALPLVPVYAWWGATQQLPPRAELLLPLAALAGPALQLANGTVDMERDRRAGVRTLAASLGRRRAVVVIASLQLVIHGIAWLTLPLSRGGESPTALVAVAFAAVLALVGVAMSATSTERRRELGWRAQAASVGLLAVGWLTAVADGAPQPI